MAEELVRLRFTGPFTWREDNRVERAEDGDRRAVPAWAATVALAEGAAVPDDVETTALMGAPVDRMMRAGSTKRPARETKRHVRA